MMAMKKERIAPAAAPQQRPPPTPAPPAQAQTVPRTRPPPNNRNNDSAVVVQPAAQPAILPVAQPLASSLAPQPPQQWPTHLQSAYGDALEEGSMCDTISKTELPSHRGVELITSLPESISAVRVASPQWERRPL